MGGMAVRCAVVALPRETPPGLWQPDAPALPRSAAGCPSRGKMERPDFVAADGDRCSEERARRTPENQCLGPQPASPLVARRSTHGHPCAAAPERISTGIGDKHNCLVRHCGTHRLHNSGSSIDNLEAYETHPYLGNASAGHGHNDTCMGFDDAAWHACLWALLSKNPPFPNCCSRFLLPQ
jgi:hypothetical protein